MTNKQRIAVIATGGTIAGKGASGDERTSYECSVLSIGDVIDTVSGIDTRATLQPEQLMQKGSENFTTSDLLLIAQRVFDLVKSDSVDAVIVTQGTDTIEENAYFLHLTVPTDKPVVVVGAMRPPHAVGSDAQSNLYDAVCVAAHPAARGMGVMVVANSEVHCARDVMKTSSFKLEAFRSPYGPLGFVVEGAPRFYRRPHRAHTHMSEWSAEIMRGLPLVALVHAYSDMTADALRNQVIGAVGLVFVGSGNGNIPEQLIAPLREMQQTGMCVVRASRTGSGVVVRNAAQPDDKYGWVVIDDQSPGKARLLLALALSEVESPIEQADLGRIQRAFYKY